MQRDGLALGGCRRFRQLRDFIHQLFLDLLGFLDIDVNDLAVVLQIEARVMAVKPRALHDIAAAHDVR